MEGRPFVISGKISNWKCCDWTPQKLNNYIKENMAFRIGKKNTQGIQYETDCGYIKASIDDFTKWVNDSCEMNITEKKNVSQEAFPFLNYSSDDYWAYADYKYMKELFRNEQSLLDVVDWSTVGLSGRNAEDSTFWLGSKGAYTVCHYDTYGSNLVAQIYGRKRWTLFPPEQSLMMYPTRIPYEESSVFSLVNIANPDFSKHALYMHCTPYAVVLEPGDILYVPRQWWHYVECLDTAISVNTWLEMGEDTEERIKEAVTRSVVCALMEDTKEDWLNPTENEFSTEENTALVNSALQESTKIPAEKFLPSINHDSKDGIQLVERFHDFVENTNIVKQYCKCYNLEEYMKSIRRDKNSYEQANIQCGAGTSNWCDETIVCKRLKIENHESHETELHTYKQCETCEQNTCICIKHNVLTDKSGKEVCEKNPKCIREECLIEKKYISNTEKLKSSDIVNCIVDREVVELITKKLKEKYSLCNKI